MNDWDEWHLHMAYVHRARVLRAQVTLRLLRLGIASLKKLLRVGLAAIAALGRSVFRAAARAHQRRVTIRALMAMSDRNLRDIGLHRSQIFSLVEEMYSGTPANARHNSARAEFSAMRSGSKETGASDGELKSAA